MVSGAGAGAAALGSAIGYATSSVVQHRTARRAPTGTGLRLGLLAHLAAQPVWLFGLSLAAVAFGLHALALSGGELAVVQPLLISGLLFALPVSVLLERRRPSINECLWALVLVAGVAAFLASARPTAGQVPSDTDRLGILVLAGTALAAAVLAMGQGRARHRATLFGLAAGITYGLTAALIKQVTEIAGRHPLDLLVSWPTYALMALGIAALVVNQVAYQAGPLAASLPPMTMADPVVAIAIGVLVFDEHLAHSALAVGVEVLSSLAVVMATVQLARRAGTKTYRSPRLT